MKSAKSIKSALLTAFALSATAAAAQTPPPAEAFGRLPYLRSVDISPDGEGLAGVVAEGGSEYIAVYDLSDGGFENTFALKIASDTEPRWIVWKDTQNLLVSLGFASRRGDVDTYETRLFHLEKEGGELSNVLDQPDYQRQQLAVVRKGNKKVTPIQIEDDVISWMWGDEKRVLLEYNRANPVNPAAFATPIDGKREKVIQPSKPPINTWYADAEGRVRGGFGRAGLDQDKPMMLIRTTGESEYRDISHRIGEIAILGFAPDGKTAYVSAASSAGTAALYEYDIISDKIGRQLFAHPLFDITGVVLDKRSGDVLGVNYIAEEAETVWFDKAVEKEIEEVSAAVGMPVRLIENTLNDRFGLYLASSSTNAGQFLVFDREGPSIFALPPQYPELSGQHFAEVISTQYKARDGVTIPAFITLPYGMMSLSEAKRSPFIVFPHGGPLSRDFRRFDYMAQFFASRGYGVLQTNFRGSAGYGAQFDELSEGAAGGAMVTDVADGAMWLVKNGHADPKKLAIVGGSYGGYAALQSLVIEPDLYSCAVGFNGVYDLPAFVREQDNYINGRSAQRFWRRLFGEGAALREASPALRGKSIDKPALLIHAKDDRTVDVSQSRKMRRALGSKAQLIELDTGGHSLLDHAARVRTLQETESFLARCLG